MPHIVIGDPLQRVAHVDAESRSTEHYLGVLVEEAPDELSAGLSAEVTLVLMYWPRLGYEEVVPGATFTLREGSKIVGFGKLYRPPGPLEAVRDA